MSPSPVDRIANVRHKHNIRRLATGGAKREGGRLPRVRRLRRAPGRGAPRSRRRARARSSSTSPRRRSTTSTSTFARASRASRSSFPHMLGVEPVGRIAALGRGRRGLGRSATACAVYLIATVRELPSTAAPAASRSALRRPGSSAWLAAAATPSSVTCKASQLIRDPGRRHGRRGGAPATSPSARPGTCSSRARRLRTGETVLVNSVGSGIGSAAVQLAQARRRVRDRHLEPRRQARARRRSSAWTSGINYTTQDVVEEVMRAHRRSRRRRRLRARRRRALPARARLAREGRPARRSAAGTPARSSRSTSSRSSAGSCR